LLFEDFVASKVITLATLIRRASSIRFQRMFGLALMEWRLLIRIGASGPLSLNELAAHVGIGKSQTSRVVTNLVQRKLVMRKRNSDYGREVELSLTAKGVKIHQGIIKAGVLRNEELTSGVDAKELERVNDTLTVLTQHARDLLQREQDISADRTPPSDADLQL
jgi:DNA-binding MarR family transcriptional regulator